MDQGLYKKALMKFDSLLDIDPDLQRVWYYRSMCFIELSRYDDARESALTAIDYDIHDIESWRALGEIHLELNELTKSFNALKRVLKSDPMDRDALYLLGNVFLKKERYDDAIRIYDKVLKIDPDDDLAYDKKKLAEFKKKRDADYTRDNNFYSEPKKTFPIKESKLDWDYTDEENEDIFDLIETGLNHLQNKDFQNALDTVEKALRIDPDDIDSLLLNGQIFFEMGQYQKAMSSFDRVTDIEKSNPEAWFNKGEILEIVNRYQDALACYKEALKNDPDFSEAKEAVVEVEAKLGMTTNIDFADPVADRMIKKKARVRENEYDVEAFGMMEHREDGSLVSDSEWVERAGKFLVQNYPQRAMVCFQKALDVNLDNVEALFGLGNSNRKIGENDIAVEFYNKALQIKPDRADIHYNKGLALLGGQKPNAAVRAFQNALRIEPDKKEAISNLGAAYNEINEMMKAMDTYNRLLKLDPKDAKAWYNLGNVYVKVGKARKAIKSYDRAIKFDPRNVQYHYNKGITYYEINKFKKAKKAFLMALKIKPGYRPAKEALVACKDALRM